MAFVNPIIPITRRDSPITRGILFICTPKLEVQLVDPEFSGRQTLQAKVAFELRDALLARIPVLIQLEDVVVNDSLAVTHRWVVSAIWDCST